MCTTVIIKVHIKKIIYINKLIEIIISYNINRLVKKYYRALIHTIFNCRTLNVNVNDPDDSQQNVYTNTLAFITISK